MRTQRRALAEREAVRHLWLDSWNHVGEGSGIFAAEPLDYTASDRVVRRVRETWTADRHQLGLTFSAALRDFHLDALGRFQTDEFVTRFGGVVRGMTGVFSVLLTALCALGTHLVTTPAPAGSVRSSSAK